MTGSSDSFGSLVLRNEYRALQGKNHRTVLYLAIILFLAFFAFGFAKSTLDYQEKLAGDPYSNWINLDYHSGTRDSLRVLEDSVGLSSFRNRYHIRGAFFYNKAMVEIGTALQGKPADLHEARSIDPGSGILSDLLSGDNTIRFYPGSTGRPFDFEPNGIIISRKLAEEQSSEVKNLVFLPLRVPSGDRVPLPVLAIVDELPDKADLVYTNLFYCKSMNPGFYDRESPFYRLYAAGFDTAGILQVLRDLYTTLRISDPASVQTTLLPTGNPSAVTWKIEIGVQENGLSREEMDRKVAALPSLRGHAWGRYFELSKDTACDNSAFFHDYLAVEFSDMQQIRPFALRLSERFGLQLGLETLSDRENYLYTGNIALGALILVMLLATFFVAVYIAGTLRNHLVSVKKNLGNFLAFGVKNATLTLLYILVTLRILATALLPAAFAAWGAGELFEQFFLRKILALDHRHDYFSLAGAWFPLFLLLILATTILRTYVTIHHILRQTPGNLIYERDR
ncbi:MAG TPA: hypothetical protein PKG48_04350 [Bacteroidales bacterium]|nr:hypothetical protein [Bacteroidales bacterium]